MPLTECVHSPVTFDRKSFRDVKDMISSKKWDNGTVFRRKYVSIYLVYAISMPFDRISFPIVIAHITTFVRWSGTTATANPGSVVDFLHDQRRQE